MIRELKHEQDVVCPPEELGPSKIFRDRIAVRAMLAGMISGTLLAAGWEIGGLFPPHHRSHTDVTVLTTLTEFPVLALVLALVLTTVSLPFTFHISRSEKKPARSQHPFVYRSLVSASVIGIFMSVLVSPNFYLLARNGWGPDGGFSGTMRVIVATVIALGTSGYFVGKYLDAERLKRDGGWNFMLLLVTWMWMPIAIIMSLLGVLAGSGCAC
ncbi:MAG TPA: hypothetical protein VGK19_00690 [Capsulimonadaceae bacterium]|jgi:amino acid transporter